MEQETNVKKINTITVSSKTFSGRAMVYQCTMCQSRFVDMDDNYRLCPYCGRKIRWIVEDSRLHLGDGENE